MIISDAELSGILQKLPGVDKTNVISLDDRYVTLSGWEQMKHLLDEAPTCPLPYTAHGVFDCDKISRWLLAILNVIWARSHIEGPAAWGVINGNVPNDGMNTTTGWHSIGFFITDDRKIHLFGCQERSCMNDDMIENIKEVDSVLVGG